MIQIARVARELIVLDAALSALANCDHFREVTKMIGRILTTIPASTDGTPNRLLEVLPTCIAKNFG